MIPDPFFKICGITRMNDALHAVREGATAIGFVFWPASPRRVATDTAAEIVAVLPASVMTVGVFVNASADEIRSLLSQTGIRAAQLHGDEPAEYAIAIGRPIIRSVTLDNVVDIAREWPVETTLLLDKADLVRRGGTGELVDWSRGLRWRASAK